MKKTKLCILCMMIFLPILLLPSCQDDDYDWDKMNKEGILYLPYTPYGDWDVINLWEIAGIPTPIPPIALPIGGYTIKYEYIESNILGEETAKRFFHKYVTKDISLSALVDIEVLTPASGLTLAVEIEVLSADKMVIERVKIPAITELKYGKSQDFKIIFPKESVEYMDDAEHLKFKIYIHTPSEIAISEGDHIAIRNIVLKTAGYFVDL